MNPINHEPNNQTNSVENHWDVAGYSVTVNPYLLPSGQVTGPADATDSNSLTKLHETGFDLESLNDAWEKFRIAPLRTIEDFFQVLGYANNPQIKGSSKVRYRDEHLTALGFPYPDPLKVMTLFDYHYYFRVRPASPIILKGLVNGKWEDYKHKYEQPSGTVSGTHSEPYFLIVEDMWTRLMSTEFPLFITEGELKACALGLAGFAAIGFPGAQMIYAPKKTGKNKLHPSLDPNGPRKGRVIPILDRDIYVIPDSDFATNKDVKIAFETLVKNLAVAGASGRRIRMVHLPITDQLNAKTGVDDYLTRQLGPRWAGSEEKIAQARSLIEALVGDSKPITMSEYLYSATAHVRGAERFLEQFNKPDKYIAKLKASAKDSFPMWAIYNCDHYNLFALPAPNSGTSVRLTVKADPMLEASTEQWTEGVMLEAEEGDADGKKAHEMKADYPNHMLGLVSPKLPTFYNETLIEPFPGVDMEDRCLRIKGGLININQCFRTGVNWDARVEWLLPPNYRWFGSGQVQVSLSNMVTKPLCPRFIDLVNNMFDGDQERIDCLQMSFGKILLAPMFLDMNKFLAFFGVAGSGKSTLTNIIQLLVGEHDVAILRSNFGGRFDTSELPGKRLILFPENEDGAQHHFTMEMCATVKKITGRDMLVCEKKGQQPISARIDAEIMIVGNAPPTVEMDEGAFKRRAIFLKVDKPIATPDFGVSKKIMEGPELAGIFLWSLEGAAKLHANPSLYKTPEACVEDLLGSNVSMSFEKRFVQNHVVEKPGCKLFMTELEEAYRQWLRFNRLPVKEPGWGKLAGAIRDKFSDRYKSEPTKDKNRTSTRVYKGLSTAEILM